MKHIKRLTLGLVALTLAACSNSGNDDDDPVLRFFNRIAVFPVCLQLNADCDTDEQTAAEIAAVSSNGNTLLYTDSPQGKLGFVDITDPTAPAGLGTLDLPGEPTSVAVAGDFALVAVNTSTDFINVSGTLVVVDIATKTVVRSIDLGGQPDSVTVSPDKSLAAIAIENERDEDLGDGAPPQAPAGFLVIVDLSGAPSAWTTRSVDLTGLATLYPGDPEPEYVDINSDNTVAISLQENNYILLVDLKTGTVTKHFTAGSADLTQVDATEEDPALILLRETLTGVPREPDGLTWLANDRLATADEGDLNGGSRGITLFDTDGNVVYTSGNSLEHAVVRIGHYPDARSGNKGNETENVDFGSYDGQDFLFAASERSSVIFVFDAANRDNPVLHQILPAGVGPEGVLAIPSRNLLIAASEEDSRGDAIRSVVNIYQLSDAPPAYPTIESINRADGTPIPWGALSGLAADPADAGIVYSVQDSFYGRSRIYTLDVSAVPAKIIAETALTDANDVFAALPLPASQSADTFDAVDRAAMINGDKTVNLDQEGIAVSADGGFWIASEGGGTVGDAARPVTSADLLFKVDRNGIIERVVTLPAAVNAIQLRFGFEGVAESDGLVYVAFQRAWNSESGPRIGIYDPATDTWRFLFYPLDAVESPNGGWVGLSDLTALGNNEFLVVERDNQGGPDARIKRLYRFSVAGLADGATVSKTLVRDLIPDLLAPGV